ncbi:hypothetical protein [Verrucomicrobium spinosum]|uniref:hypothetical protein n=1 Tax=Verrucomicrobium spinosum TaxID=2736 RepID=UPI000946334F|nr:hypothetical protein [Verrucomicrobium spinosum]
MTEAQERAKQQQDQEKQKAESVAERERNKTRREAQGQDKAADRDLTEKVGDLAKAANDNTEAGKAPRSSWKLRPKRCEMERTARSWTLWASCSRMRARRRTRMRSG